MYFNTENCIYKSYNFKFIRLICTFFEGYETITVQLKIMELKYSFYDNHVTFSGTYHLCLGGIKGANLSMSKSDIMVFKTKKMATIYRFFLSRRKL